MILILNKPGEVFDGRGHPADSIIVAAPNCIVQNCYLGEMK